MLDFSSLNASFSPSLDAIPDDNPLLADSLSELSANFSSKLRRT